MQPTIRPIQYPEYPLLQDFLYHAIFLPPGAEQPPREVIFQPSLSIYVDDFGQPDDCGLVAVSDNMIVGAAWTRIVPGHGHIDDETPELAISVLPAFRGQGTGTALLVNLFEHLREQGYMRISLSVQKSNPALRLYKRLGYQIFRENTEDIIMVKELADPQSQLRVHESPADISRIRPWQTKDARDLAAALNNKNVLNNLRDGIPFPYTKRDAAAYIRAMQNAEPDSQYPFAVTLDDKAIGSISVVRRDNIHHLTAELGYYVAEDHWHKGIMTEAVRQICAYVFENTNIVRIFAEPFAHNRASCRVLEKAGFRLEGKQRQNAVKNGVTLDMMLYSRLRTYPIRPLDEDDIEPALALVWQVFSEFVAPEYTSEGIAEFKAFIGPAAVLAAMKNAELRLWGAFDNNVHTGSTELAGVVAVKQPLHISLLFVDKQHHGRGIARALLETAETDAEAEAAGGGLRTRTVTVHSSPNAASVYRRLGFVSTDTEKTVNGLRFIPMERQM